MVSALNQVPSGGGCEDDIDIVKEWRVKEREFNKSNRGGRKIIRHNYL